MEYRNAEKIMPLEWLLSAAQLEGYLEELVSWEALELEISGSERVRTESERTESGRSESGCRIRIPYVMNDAAECYIEIDDCTISGTWEQDYEGPVTWAVNVRENLKQLTLRQGAGASFQVNFRNAQMVLGCYQYHLIGHAWRDTPGEEYIRRLVNLVCVLHDKYTYLGEIACNEKEIRLCHLAEFAPFRYWTPIDDSIMDWYEDTPLGAETAAQLAEKAGEEKFAAEIRAYESARSSGNVTGVDISGNIMEADTSGNITDADIARLARRFLLPEGRKVWELLLSQISEASLMWPQRQYNPALQARIDRLRREKQEEFLAKGYLGEYPCMTLYGPSGELCDRVRFVEEHPFTVMESEEYEFRVFEEREFRCLLK